MKWTFFCSIFERFFVLQKHALYSNKMLYWIYVWRAYKSDFVSNLQNMLIQHLINLLCIDRAIWTRKTKSWGEQKMYMLTDCKSNSCCKPVWSHFCIWWHLCHISGIGCYVVRRPAPVTDHRHSPLISWCQACRDW